MESGDLFKRINITADSYQCGCFWEKVAGIGDVLRQCPIHQRATEAMVQRFNRERKAQKSGSHD